MASFSRARLNFQIKPKYLHDSLCRRYYTKKLLLHCSPSQSCLLNYLETMCSNYIVYFILPKKASLALSMLLFFIHAAPFSKLYSV